jgi:hypothetical protein
MVEQQDKKRNHGEADREERRNVAVQSERFGDMDYVHRLQF